MIPRNKIAAIHIAKNKANLNDADYRAVLQRVADVSSCKDLEAKDIGKVLYELNNQAVACQPRPGWKDSQLKKFRQYVRLCKMGMSEARQLLYHCGGAMNEESPDLKQVDFDDVMAAIETELETRVKAGTSSVPGHIQLQYWRQRHPNKGAVNTRESHLIFGLWNDLKAYLGEEKRTAQYLLGFAAHVCRLNRAKAVEDLSAREALKVIDALKRRIVQEQKKAADVPF
ncbi:MAG: DUF1018 domain-containing protein [Victivallaceae bacterium]|nr:DUF1018 domain-containing protein [Victivallaceae bacterium]